MPLLKRNKRKPTKERKPFMSDEEWEKEEEEEDEIEAMEMMDDDWTKKHLVIIKSKCFLKLIKSLLTRKILFCYIKAKEEWFYA